MPKPPQKPFSVIKSDKRTRARLGRLFTPHGMIETPSYVFVGTYGQIRYLTPRDIKSTQTQLIISNTFHLWQEVLKNKKLSLKNKNLDTFLTQKMGLKIPTMTDSGGFQVLSLAFGMDNRVGKFITDRAQKTKSYKRRNVRISPAGVHFTFMGQELFLGPELSIDIQHRIGADITFAFDHITGPLDGRSYNRRALVYTTRWAKMCLERHLQNQSSSKHHQLLFGIIQGGVFRDLRIESTRQIANLPFDGFGIGGSYTQKQIAKILNWIIPHLPEEKPRHLLGVGKVIDIFEAVEKGIDTFDCVIPTREARHGRLYTKHGPFDIRSGREADRKVPIEKGCKCPICRRNITRAKLHGLFRSDRETDKVRVQRYALIHNMWFFNELLESIRQAIGRGKFLEFKKSFLKRYEKNV